MYPCIKKLSDFIFLVFHVWYIEAVIFNQLTWEICFSVTLVDNSQVLLIHGTLCTNYKKLLGFLKIVFKIYHILVRCYWRQYWLFCLFNFNCWPSDTVSWNWFTSPPAMGFNFIIIFKSVGLTYQLYVVIVISFITMLFSYWLLTFFLKQFLL